jgi:hypothetical protein
MEKNNSIVEEALLQMRAVEDAINENAKGILASTMKEEISELVRESLGGSKKSKKSLVEQEEEDDVDVTDETDDYTEDGDDTEDFDETEFDTDVMAGFPPVTGVEDDNQDAMAPLDMTQAPMSDVLKVFKAMGDNDGIIVKKDDVGNIRLTDSNKDSEYLIQMDGMDNTDMPMRAQTNENVLYELSFDDEEDGDEYGEYDESADPTDTSGESGAFTAEGWDDEDEDEDEDEIVYELEMEESFKPKGNVGKMKFKYPSKLRKGVTEMGDYEEENEWKEMDDMAYDPFVDEDDDEEEAGETKESARTLGNGSRNYPQRKSLPKMRVRPTNEGVTKELNLLREKNEEYKKALDFFRNKLNEVAVFNSNLAYSTRLFTEHTTTKQEKINILRRFDSIESLKESKNLYKTIKTEIDSTSSDKGVFTESIERKVSKTPQNGSSTNLIESKTYENPQFMRMKDLMTKIK